MTSPHLNKFLEGNISQGHHPESLFSGSMEQQRLYMLRKYLFNLWEGKRRCWQFFSKVLSCKLPERRHWREGGTSLTTYSLAKKKVIISEEQWRWSRNTDYLCIHLFSCSRLCCSSSMVHQIGVNLCARRLLIHPLHKQEHLIFHRSLWYLPWVFITNKSKSQSLNKYALKTKLFSCLSCPPMLSQVVGGNKIIGFLNIWHASSLCSWSLQMTVKALIRVQNGQSNATIYWLIFSIEKKRLQLWMLTD